VVDVAAGLRAGDCAIADEMKTTARARAVKALSWRDETDIFMEKDARLHFLGLVETIVFQRARQTEATVGADI
jgi:hypothetical protein